PTRTAPLATSALPAPPLSHRPASLSSWLSSTWSPSSWKSIVCIGGSLRVAGARGLLQAAPARSLPDRRLRTICHVGPHAGHASLPGAFREETPSFRNGDDNEGCGICRPRRCLA